MKGSVEPIFCTDISFFQDYDVKDADRRFAQNLRCDACRIDPEIDNMKERRVLQRTKLSFYLKVNEAHSSLYIGDIVDINVCSFLTVGPVEANIGREYSLHIHLPKPLAGQSHVRCHAIARRCDRVQDDDTHEIGFEIANIEPLDRRILEHLISEFELKFAI